MASPDGHTRNGKLFDVWSIAHFFISAGLTVLIGPIPTLIIVTIWEPLEIFVISPLVAKFGITFGHESLANSLSDIFFNSAGVLAAYLLIS